MRGQFIIKPQNYSVDGHAPLSYGVFLETDEAIEGLEYWQGPDYRDVFVCYSWSRSGAERAIEELRRSL